MHPPGHWITGIGSEKVRVSFQRVALQRHDIRFLRVKIANWPCAERGCLFSRNGGWWGIGCPLEEHERCRYLGGVPWHLGALGHVVDTESCAFEDAGEWQAAFADHLSECLGIGSIGALTFRSHRSGRRIEGDQHAGLGLDQGQAAGERWTGIGEWISPRRVENDDAGLELHRGKRPGVIGNSECLDCNLGIAGNARVNRNEIVLAFELQAIAADVDKGDRVRAGGRRFLHKVAKGVAQHVLIEVTSAHHVEARGLERLCDQAGVVGRGVKRSCLIAGVPDNERDALLRLCRPWRDNECQRKEGNEVGDELANPRHNGSKLGEMCSCTAITKRQP